MQQGGGGTSRGSLKHKALPGSGTPEPAILRGPEPRAPPEREQLNNHGGATMGADLHPFPGSSHFINF